MSKKNPNLPLRVFLSDKFRLHSQRNQLKNILLEFLDDGISKDIVRMLGLPSNKVFRKLRLIMSSSNTKDLLILAINMFKTLQSVKENDLF